MMFTNRLLIKEITRKDIADIHRMNSFAAVAQFNTIGIPADITDTEKLLQTALEDQQKAVRVKYSWAIRLKDTLEFVGEIGMKLSVPRYRKGEIYYGLPPQQWGRGYATEAAQCIINFGFEQLNLHRIEAGVATENVRSIKLLEKLGMTREGRHRKILPINGEWKDNFHYAILDEDERIY